eukprot:1160079-Pelagomonas_calceolata.AAC.12
MPVMPELMKYGLHLFLGTGALLKVHLHRRLPSLQCWHISNGDCSLFDAGAFPKIIALLHGNEEALKRECAFTLANPWASNVGISPDVADLLIKDGVLKVGACVQVDAPMRRQELVDLLDLSVDTSIVKVAIQGLQEATKRGQQMMRDEANKQMAEGQEEPNVSNRIAEVIKEHVSDVSMCMKIIETLVCAGEGVHWPQETICITRRDQPAFRSDDRVLRCALNCCTIQLLPSDIHYLNHTT